jgi:hypothetical protein
MRRSLLAAAAALLAGTSIAAAGRPSTLSMSCAEAAATVATTGAIVLTTGEFTYNRFVAHGGFCLQNEDLTPARAPTLDAPDCPIGYTCEPRMNTFNGR